MITRENINGEWATVSHLTDSWEPCEPEDATMVKVLFDGGRVLFGKLTPEPVTLTGE
jgi:hypothetical protein